MRFNGLGRWKEREIDVGIERFGTVVGLSEIRLGRSWCPPNPLRKACGVEIVQGNVVPSLVTSQVSPWLLLRTLVVARPVGVTAVVVGKGSAAEIDHGAVLLGSFPRKHEVVFDLDGLTFR